ncbi:MFS transporter [Acaricomes phytoseiuli]|uniref:MFS transporter n=1 Tax=Acaricomes phytoseiuli TaxID=291968 RepID=UPI00039EE1B7|nr:MFS transporter [Acaricomes phytoseiuli]
MPSSQPPSSWVGHPRGSSAYRRMLIALACAGIATFAQLYSVQGVLPLIAADLGVSAADAALTVSAATLGIAASVIPWSVAGDRFGRRRTMFCVVIAATSLALIAPLMPTLPALLALRFLKGAALGGIPALALTYLGEQVDRRHAGAAAGTYVAGTTIGGLLGRVVAGPVGDALGWRAGVFLVGLLAVTAALSFVLLAPREQGFQPGRSGPGLGRKLLHNLQNPGLLALYAQGFLLMGGFVAVYNFLGFRLEEAPFFLPATITSLLFLTYLSGTFSARIAGGLSGRFRRGAVMAASTLVMIAGTALTMLEWLPAILLGLVILTAGFFAAHAIASGWVPLRATTGPAQASALYNLGYYAGSSVIGWVCGLVFQSAGWNGLALAVTGLASIALVLGWLTRQR